MVDQSHKLFFKKRPRLNCGGSSRFWRQTAVRRKTKKSYTSTYKIFIPPSIRLSPLLTAQLLTSKSSPAPGPEQICKLSTLTCLFAQITPPTHCPHHRYLERFLLSKEPTHGVTAEFHTWLASHEGMFVLPIQFAEPTNIP